MIDLGIGFASVSRRYHVGASVRWLAVCVTLFDHHGARADGASSIWAEFEDRCLTRHLMGLPFDVDGLTQTIIHKSKDAERDDLIVWSGDIFDFDLWLQGTGFCAVRFSIENDKAEIDNEEFNAWAEKSVELGAYAFVDEYISHGPVRLLSTGSDVPVIEVQYEWYPDGGELGFHLERVEK